MVLLDSLQRTEPPSMLLKELLKLRIAMVIGLGFFADILFSFNLHRFRLQQSNGGEFYLNPWTKIENPRPQIIKFNSNGELIKNDVPNKHFINIRKLTRSLRSRKSLNAYFRLKEPHIWNSTEVLNEINNLINTMHAEGAQYHPRDRAKILTHCNKKSTICRFLTCPHIKEYCTLCEVYMDETSDNSTVCEKISTKFLHSQFRFK